MRNHKGLDSHEGGHSYYYDESKGDILFSPDFGHDVGPENGSSYLDYTHEHLIKVDVESEFVETKKGTIEYELDCEIDDATDHCNVA